MPSNRWLFLEEVQSNITNGTGLPPRMALAIAERIDEAISSPTRAPVAALSSQLAALLDILVKAAPPQANPAAFKPFDYTDTASAAYQLGQVSFAQMLSSQVSERRVDDDFATTVRDIRYRPYVDALSRRDLSGKQLSETCLECVETVSRKLRQLRELGITDFRREGTSFVNFLTPAARSVVEQMNYDNHRSNLSVRANASRVESVIENTPEKMRRVPMFGKKAA